MGADRGLLQTATRAVAGLGVLVAVLAGCTNDPEPIVTTTPTLSPTASPSASASASPTPTPSPSATALTEEEVLAQIPAGARTEDLVSAASFARHFLGLYQPMFNAPYDQSAFRTLSTDDCVFCDSALSSASDAAAEKSSTEGGELDWPDHVALATGGVDSAGHWYVTQRYELSPRKSYDQIGDLIDESGASSGEVGVELLWSEGRWSVNGVEVSPGS